MRSLGFQDIKFVKEAALVDGQTYAISHRACNIEKGLLVHIEGARVDVDKRPLTGRPRISPQGLVQEYLNRTEHLWAMVTNGNQFRLLRNFTRMSRPTYLEFDLKGMMDGEQFSEFHVFYRLVHRSRWPVTMESASECWLEKYYLQSIEEGGRVREHLRDGVEEALKVFGNGFLSHPANEELRSKLTARSLSDGDYYRQLLHLIYRFLFLMVSEERKLGPFILLTMLETT